VVRHPRIFGWLRPRCNRGHWSDSFTEWTANSKPRSVHHGFSQHEK
jgi:hypothetical protein